MSKKHIDYSSRMKKNIERKMICDLLERIGKVYSLKEYNYIGMGSYYFSDFILFYKQFGFTQMTSIEHDKQNMSRYEFNRPFKNIDIQFMTTSKYFEKYNPQSTKHFIWLDYTDGIESYMLNDIDRIFRKENVGSFVAVSLKCEFEDIYQIAYDDLLRDGKISADNVDNFINVIEYIRQSKTNNLLPTGYNQTNFGANYLKILNEVFNAMIIESCNARNKRGKLIKIKPKQLLNIDYNDGTHMLTMGWYIDDFDNSTLSSIDLSDLGFIYDGIKTTTIKCPILTEKEINHLNALFPLDSAVTECVMGISPKTINDYHELFRYYPIYIERF